MARPSPLSLVLFGALFAVALLLIGTRINQGPGVVNAADIAGVNPEPKSLEPAADPPVPSPPPPVAPVTNVAPGMDPAPAGHTTLPSTGPPAARTVALAPTPGAEPPRTGPEEVVDIDTSGSQDSPITTRGFGDVGMQFQEVEINAPVTVVHVSNEGNHNAINANIGDGNRSASEQRRLQSNRADGGQPPASSSVGAQTDEPPSQGPAGRARSVKPDRGGSQVHT